MVAGDLAEQGDHPEHAVEVLRRVEEQHRHPEAAELLDLLALLRGHEQQVRLEHEGALRLGAGVGELRQRFRLGGEVGELVGRDDTLPRADGEEDLRCAGRVGDDPRGRRLQRHRGPGGVLNGQREGGHGRESPLAARCVEVGVAGVAASVTPGPASGLRQATRWPSRAP